MRNTRHVFLAGPLFLLATLLAGCSGGGNSSPTQPVQQSKPPYIILSSPSSAAPGTSVTLSATGTYDPQGEALTYAWNFGDGTTGSGVSVQHTYAQEGSYSITLTVTDTSGLSSYEIAMIQIGRTPIADAGGPYTAYIYVPITFNGAGSSDPDGGALTYQWNFGDGSTGTGATPTHTYTTIAGTYKVTLKVTSAAGLSASAATTVALETTPPTVTTNGPWTGRVGLPVDFTSTVSDPIDDDWSYQWLFGDGGTSATADPTHTYTSPGTYNVSLTVTGQYQESTTVNLTATVTAQSTTPTVSGVVDSGDVPIVGAHVYLFAAGAGGYNQPSVSLLSGTGASDALGDYVTTDANGAFTIASGFSCPATEQVFLYAGGGTVSGNANSAGTLIDPVGSCGYLGLSGALTVNEATTVAAAFALTGYSGTPLEISSPNTTAAQTGLANAFLNAANLVSPNTGLTLQTTPAGNGTVPQALMNTLASLLNNCIQGDPSDACSTLFSATTFSGAAPTDTASAIFALAHHPTANPGALLNGQPVAPPFRPVLSSAPHSWTPAISYTGVYQTQGVAIDSGGNVWVLQYPSQVGAVNGDPILTELASNGDILVSESTTCNAGSVATPQAIAIDTAGNSWLLAVSGSTYSDDQGDEYSYYLSDLCTVSPAGVMLLPPGGTILGGSETSTLPLYSLAIDGMGNGWIPSTTLIGSTLKGQVFANDVIGNAPVSEGIAFDAAGDFWIASPETNGIVELSPSGQLLSPPGGYSNGGITAPSGVAIDHNGNVWAIDSGVDYPNAGHAISGITSTGTAITPSGGVTGGEIVTPYALAIDGANNVWIANGYDYGTDPSPSVVELAPTGAVTLFLDHATSSEEYSSGPQSIAVDSTGSVWLSDGNTNTVTQFIGVATPVVTPLAANLAPPYNGPASRP